MAEVKKKVLIYWPFSELLNVHFYKDPCGIPIGFKENGYDSVLVVGKNKSNINLPFKIYESNLTNWRNVFYYYREFLKVINIIYNERPEIIIAYNRGPLLPLIVLSIRLRSLLTIKNRFRPKILLKMDSDGEFNNFRNALKIFIQAIITINSKLFDFMMIETQCGAKNIQKYILEKEKVIVIPNAHSIGPAMFSHKIINRRPIILSVARVSREKGIDVLIRAFSKISAIFPDWNLIVSGEVSDIPYYNELIKLISELGLSKRINLLGNVEWKELQKLYDVTSIFALMSFKESFGIARIEAMAHGIPILTTPAGCGNDLSKYGAVIVPAGNINETADALKRLVSDKDLREEISKNQLDGVKTWSEVSRLIIRTCNL